MKSAFAGPSRFAPGVPCRGELALSPPPPRGLPHRPRHRTPGSGPSTFGEPSGRQTGGFQSPKRSSVSLQPGDRVRTRRQTAEGDRFGPRWSPAFWPSQRRRALCPGLSGFRSGLSPSDSVLGTEEGSAAPSDTATRRAVGKRATEILLS